MENKYQIKVWATAEYLNSENSSNVTAKFLSRLEWKKVFLHKLDDEDEKFVWISQYEKTEQQKIHFSFLEEIEEKEEEREEEVQEIEELQKIDYKNLIISFLKKNLTWIMIWFIFWFFTLYSSNFSTLQASIFENSENEVNIFESLSERVEILEKKENFELEKQKNLREEKKVFINQKDQEIKTSIEEVKKIRKEKEEIAKQKIELAQ